MNIEQAAAYHRRHTPHALRIEQGEALLFDAYEDVLEAGTPHALYSGTKSFWGIAAVIAEREGLLALDEPAWRGASARELLNLTAGLPFGGLGSAVPTYERALATQPRDAPGARFTYGGISLQIFGAILAQRLTPLHMTPHDYLHERVLKPNHIDVASWRVLRDGTHPLPTDASMSALHWARFGHYVVRNAAALRECFLGSHANPRYGLCWWLAPPGAPQDLTYASGSGGQAVYVVPSQRLVVVRFGGGGAFNHAAFLKRLFST